MSTVRNQYFMYGILMSYNWHKEWETKTGKNFYNTYEEFMSDNAYDTIIRHKDGIFCLFDGRDGKYIIIGRVLQKTGDDDPFLGNDKPLKVPELDEHEKMIIKNSVLKHFGFKGKFNFYFITHYR